jgi:hypothetical protein
VVFFIYYRLKGFAFSQTVPGGRLGMVETSLWGFEPNSLVYYSEILVNRFEIAWALCILYAALIIVQKLNTDQKSIRNIAYIASFPMTYVIILGYVVTRAEMRFILVVVPMLSILFGFVTTVIVKYLTEIAQENIINRRKHESVSFSNRFAQVSSLSTVQAVVIILVLLAQVSFGGSIVAYHYSEDRIPDTEEQNWELISQHIQGHEYAFHSKAMHQKISNTKDAALLVNKLSDNKDIVITTSNFNPNAPYTNVDYNTNSYISGFLGFEQNGTRYELYRGIEILTTEESTRQVFQSNCQVYIIADRYFEQHATDELREYIKSNSEKIYVSDIANSSKKTWVFNEDNRVRVYRQSTCD